MSEASLQAVKVVPVEITPEMAKAGVIAAMEAASEFMEDDFWKKRHLDTIERVKADDFGSGEDQAKAMSSVSAFYRAMLAASPALAATSVGSFTVDDLAQEIRRVDGNHDLGAGALAEALMPFLSRSAAPAGGGLDREAVARIIRETYDPRPNNAPDDWQDNAEEAADRILALTVPEAKPEGEGA